MSQISTMDDVFRYLRSKEFKLSFLSEATSPLVARSLMVTSSSEVAKTTAILYGAPFSHDDSVCSYSGQVSTFLYYLITLILLIYLYYSIYHSVFDYNF